MKNAESKLLLQAIYDELAKDPPSEQVRERFEAAPYYMRKEEKHGKSRDIHEKQN